MGSGASRGRKTEATSASPQRQQQQQPLISVPIPVQPIQQHPPSPRRSARQRCLALHSSHLTALYPLSQGESHQSPHSRHSSPRHQDHHHHQEEEGEDESEHSEEEFNEQEEENMRMHFAQSAMSLGMDNDDLIFNLLYFGDNSTSFQTMFNSAIEETVAAHSAGNTSVILSSVSHLTPLPSCLLFSSLQSLQTQASNCGSFRFIESCDHDKGHES